MPGRNAFDAHVSNHLRREELFILQSPLPPSQKKKKKNKSRCKNCEKLTPCREKTMFSLFPLPPFPGYPLSLSPSPSCLFADGSTTITNVQAKAATRQKANFHSYPTMRCGRGQSGSGYGMDVSASLSPRPPSFCASTV